MGHVPELDQHSESEPLNPQNAIAWCSISASMPEGLYQWRRAPCLSLIRKNPGMAGIILGENKQVPMVSRAQAEGCTLSRNVANRSGKH
jgi:hypothetical protein